MSLNARYTTTKNNSNASIRITDVTEYGEHPYDKANCRREVMYSDQDLLGTQVHAESTKPIPAGQDYVEFPCASLGSGHIQMNIYPAGGQEADAVGNVTLAELVVI